ncbi:hypothetical protein I601_1516 [Nocardioides dokdonensis FR1436]|uniref:Uncharacterized protein n=1 Tax=Nocardioides dokdonensis FR1436 TaxID=1300347 RepID=A0A1A9GKD9_9ACTN|nr:hypothetical protein [Nocardioides dokdonensis]ANH37951.1 hypothetical protein I601_1516 [Nocardioides dokdonensis FR1436]
MTQQLRTSRAARSWARVSTRTTPLAAPGLDPAPDPTLAQARCDDLRDRHTAGLTRLMTSRDDLRGVHALADLVDDAVRWSA